MGYNSIEKYLEHKFVTWCNDHGCRALKGPSYQYKGIPDRIVVLAHGGGTLWVEFKGNTEYQLMPIQQVWRDILMDSDPKRYFVINTKDELQALITYCESLMTTLDKEN